MLTWLRGSKLFLSQKTCWGLNDDGNLCYMTQMTSLPRESRPSVKLHTRLVTADEVVFRSKKTVRTENDLVSSNESCVEFDAWAGLARLENARSICDLLSGAMFTSLQNNIRQRLMSCMSWG
ncbi:hypothetical protein J6590_001965 [Homalodisca vitripennis]|nr:hypothetical protein J6590_001965 [Homalodisca vitripennis]